MCTPIPHPEYPNDYAYTMLKTMVNQDMLTKEGLGLSWFRSSRLSQMYHISLVGLLKFISFGIFNTKAMNDKLEMLCQEARECKKA